MKRKYHWKITDRKDGSVIQESNYPFEFYEDAKDDLFETVRFLKNYNDKLLNYTIYETDDSIGVNKFAENEDTTPLFNDYVKVLMKM